MTQRKGLTIGSGRKGYYNIQGKDPLVHRQSAMGIKQPQRMPSYFNDGGQTAPPIDDPSDFGGKEYRGITWQLDRSLKSINPFSKKYRELSDEALKANAKSEELEATKYRIANNIDRARFTKDKQKENKLKKELLSINKEHRIWEKKADVADEKLEKYVNGGKSKGGKNLMAKMRTKENPYEIWRSHDGTWEWRVMKKHQEDDNKPYARWMCAVKTPNTFGTYDIGDVYVEDIKKYATKVN